MANEREIRKEKDFWGNERDYVYKNDKKVGEIKTEDRGGFLGIGTETVKVEYDSSGKETSYTKNEDRGGFLGIGSKETEVRYNADHKEKSHSTVEQRGGFLGFGRHHVRVEYDNDDIEISQTNTERRGGFLGFGDERRRVTRYSKLDMGQSRHGGHGGHGGHYRSEPSSSARRNSFSLNLSGFDHDYFLRGAFVYSLAFSILAAFIVLIVNPYDLHNEPAEDIDIISFIAVYCGVLLAIWISPLIIFIYVEPVLILNAFFWVSFFLYFYGRQIGN